MDEIKETVELGIENTPSDVISFIVSEQLEATFSEIESIALDKTGIPALRAQTIELLLDPNQENASLQKIIQNLAQENKEIELKITQIVYEKIFQELKIFLEVRYELQQEYAAQNSAQEVVEKESESQTTVDSLLTQKLTAPSVVAPIATVGQRFGAAASAGGNKALGGNTPAGTTPSVPRSQPDPYRENPL